MLTILETNSPSFRILGNDRTRAYQGRGQGESSGRRRLDPAGLRPLEGKGIIYTKLNAKRKVADYFLCGRQKVKLIVIAWSSWACLSPLAVERIKLVIWRADTLNEVDCTNILNYDAGSSTMDDR